MTPEEILNDYFRNSENYAEDAYDQAIEAIKQYAKDMCDKQKDECVMAVSRFGNEDIEEACGDALYPLELQD